MYRFYTWPLMLMGAAALTIGMYTLACWYAPSKGDSCDPLFVG